MLGVEALPLTCPPKSKTFPEKSAPPGSELGHGQETELIAKAKTSP